MSMITDSTRVRTEFWHRVLSAFTLEKPIFEAEFLLGARPQPLVRQGIFVPDTPDRKAQCPICNEYTPVEVVKDADGQDIYRLACCYPFKRINPKRLRVWRVCEGPLIDRFVKTAGIKGPRKEIIPQRAWRLGRHGQQVFLYLNRVTMDDLKTFGPVLSRFPNAVFVVPTNVIQSRLEITLSNRCLVLAEVSSLDSDYRIVFDTPRIETFIEPEAREKPKSVVRRGNRSVNIEKLVHELRQHLLAARDHYWETGNLLPKPKMEDLGRMVGIEKYAVSRCIRDPDADKLRFLWQHADDIDFIRDWKG